MWKKLFASVIDFFKAAANPPPKPPSSPPVIVSSAPEKAFDAPLDALRDALLVRHNMERMVAGRAPLEQHPALNAAAQAYVEVMLEKRVLSHTADGSTVTIRAREANYAGEVCGENIAQGYPTIEAAVRAWMRSDGHRHNILLPECHEVGFGVRADRNGGMWWCTVFGCERREPHAQFKRSPVLSPESDCSGRQPPGGQVG